MAWKMKHLFYLSLFLISSVCLSSDEPKFHFKECVRITRGFYKNCKGTVEAFYANRTYDVDVADCRGGAFRYEFPENNLEIATGCQ